MRDETGNEMTESELLKESITLISNVCCLLWETRNPDSHAAAIMADSLLKYLQVIYREDNVLKAFVDYNTYENEVYIKSGKHLRVIK